MNWPLLLTLGEAIAQGFLVVEASYHNPPASAKVLLAA